jgi:flagellar protein FlaI
MFHLLIAALRSRPNYIIVGEIRGEEGNIAFQAMQTGHPVCSTFHAGSPRSMIQRLTGHPINVPIASIDNLNFVLIQQAVEQHGHFVRRVLSLTEIERYYDVENKMITRTVFNWDPATDLHAFRGMFNSYILEKKIALMLGYEDTREIYKDLELRKRILEKMVENKIFNYFDVWNVIAKYHTEGVNSLPFTL